MKYTTPSIEVVTFNASDAPRVGMQWWYSNGPGTYAPIPAGHSYNGPTNINNSYLADMSANGVPCSNVEVFTCIPETALPADAQRHYTYNYAWVMDDGKSC